MKNVLLSLKKDKNNDINNYTAVNQITFSSNQVSLSTMTQNCNAFHFSTCFILMALSVHGFFEGFAVGVQNEYLEIGYIFLAIFFHKWVEALTIV